MELRTIDFTITEVPGKFITTPNVATHLGIDIDAGPGKYLCTDCNRLISDNTQMYLDMSDPAKGWRHQGNCDDDPAFSRVMAKKRVAAAYMIVKVKMPDANVEERLKAVALRLDATKGLDNLVVELIALKTSHPEWWAEEGQKFYDSL